MLLQKNISYNYKGNAHLLEVQVIFNKIWRSKQNDSIVPFWDMRLSYASGII